MRGSVVGVVICLHHNLNSSGQRALHIFVKVCVDNRVLSLLFTPCSFVPCSFVVEFQRHVSVTEFVLVEMADVCCALFSSFGTWFHVTRLASVSCAAENYACEPQSVTLRVSSVFTRCIPHWPIALSRPSGHPASLRCVIVHDSHHVVDGMSSGSLALHPHPRDVFRG